ncbi:MAG: hypothetical protein Q4A70_02705 [Candidatus Saccharibacteria bacterium]|nr:hypothetical protein [Candidatus Saccharibacteria bacterium]
MMQIVRPYIERRFDESIFGSITERGQMALDICEALERSDIFSLEANNPLKKGLYDAMEKLLSNLNSQRILLYFPLELLEGAPESFRDAYMKAWHRLVNVDDVREDFHKGEAYSSGGQEKIAKCLHFLPWLIEYGYLSARERGRIFEFGTDVLKDNFEEPLYPIRFSFSDMAFNNHALDRKEYCKALFAEPLRRQKPLSASKGYDEWIKDRDGCGGAPLLTPYAKLEGPFDLGLKAIMPRLTQVAERLKEGEIVLVGGPVLKGYGTSESELEIWQLDDLEPLFYQAEPEVAHICFDSVWLSRDRSENTRDLKFLADQFAKTYEYSKTKKESIEQIERDLLRKELLHWGFARFTSSDEFATSELLSIDGDCPFYDYEYRRIATMLFAKYVFI